jgi:hypothetical protein
MEAKYIFRNEPKDSSMEQCIRKMMEIYDPINIEELCRNSGCSKEEIRSALEMLIQRGEVERLSPWNYKNDDMDFFRLPGPFRSPKIITDNSRWFAGLKRAARLLFDDKEDNIERHNLNNILTMS